VKVIDEICELFARRGDEAYFGEPVSQLAHALQTAHQAKLSGASDAMIVAALLHDVGHLIHGMPEDIADKGLDARHEAAGAAWLRCRDFPAAVTEPVRLHVAAKRYLCATNAGYFSRLSAVSAQSLALQGGVMSGDEVQAFEQQPFFRESLRLRAWDEAAKSVGVRVPELSHYRARLETVLGGSHAEQRGQVGDSPN
jgi:[1-hydroxy-2-(trimethylamino)ethyl]phosphonate dioxygenase